MVDALIGRLSSLPQFPTWVRYLLTTLLVALSFAIRLVLDRYLHAYPFLLFFPAIMFAGLVFNHGTGVYALFLSAILALYFFIEPHGSLAVPDVETLVVLLLFVIVGLLLVAVVEALRSAVLKLSEERAALALEREKVAASERAKGELLEELTHRVKNNLQIVAGMLSSQARGIDPARAAEALTTAAQRVMVMGRVHSRLSAQEGGAAVDMQTFLTELCDDLRASMIGEQPVTLAVDVLPGAMHLDQAVPLGLIVNELVTNALKYAFPGGGPGTIRIRLGRRDEDLELVVADDGVGLQPDRPGGLGRRLLRALVVQIGGALDVSSGPGTTWTVRFRPAHA